MISVERLRSLMRYDPATGRFHRLYSSGRNGAGEIAGYAHCKGYWTICVKQELFLAHRLAWFYMTGEMPRDEIDHINGDRRDNRWSNLRSVSVTMNRQNIRRAFATSTTGRLGVARHKRLGADRFSARICVSGVHHHLGMFATPDEAHAVYLQAKRQLHEGNTL